MAVSEAECPVVSANLELARYEAAAKAHGGSDGERLAGFKSQVAAAEADLAEVQVSAAKAKATMEGARPGDPAAPAPVAPTAGSTAPVAAPDDQPRP